MTKNKGHVAAFIDRDHNGCPCVFLHRVHRGKHVRYLTVEEIEDYLTVNTFLDLEKRGAGRSGGTGAPGGEIGLKLEAGDTGL